MIMTEAVAFHKNSRKINFFKKLLLIDVCHICCIVLKSMSSGKLELSRFES